MTQKLQRQIVCGMLVIFLSVQAAAAVNKKLPSRTLRTMARVYMTYGNFDRARLMAEKAISTAQASDETESNEMALCLIDLATVYGNLGLLSDADRFFRAGIDLQKKALFDTHPYVAQTYRMLSDVQRRAGQLEKAEQSLAEAVSIMLNHCDLQSKEMSPFILESAKLLEAKGDLPQAQINYQMALEMIHQNYGNRHLLTANVLESMAQCSLMQSDYDKANDYVAKALTIRRQLFGRQNPLMIDTWLTKARICRAQGQLDRSEYYMSKAVASVEKSRNVVTLARVYQEINQIRNDGVMAAAGELN